MIVRRIMTMMPVVVKRAMMAEVEWEVADPGIDILVKEVSLVLVDVHPVDAASHQAILMCVEWLEDFLAAFPLTREVSRA